MTETVNPGTTSSPGLAAIDVELKQVVKIFNQEPAVSDLNLQVRQGEFFSILGPSGCGKTTTLRLIAGFERPSSGQILIQGINMVSRPAYRRPVNTVFQSYALFDHLTVADNIAFGLNIQRLPRSQVRDRVSEALRLVRMEGLSDRRPAQLSGGQQQRVALARALVNRPAVMLLDEPLGALDLKLRKQMQLELANLHRQLGITFIMVTHDQEEALCLSDRIAVMNRGHLEQVGTPQQIYDHPASAFVADFIGDTNLLSGSIDSRQGAYVQVVTAAGLKIWVAANDGAGLVGPTAIAVSIRPEKIHLSLVPFDQSDNLCSGHIRRGIYLGSHVHWEVSLLSGETLRVLEPNRGNSELAVNTPVYLGWQADDCRLLQGPVL
ncbi:MAG: ABC transporter ATP-binding protein [Cyanobacteria bacterium REEB459]|nr:ABC transporter ATP-binding protein [Cyanobacteria bacterium REEB459]